jgi:ATP-dependent Clp protease ATP-binding subunit ClpB
VVNFTNTILIMTSNLAEDPRLFFKPEFVNRIDEIIRFAPLTEADLTKIVDLQLDGLRARLADRRLELVVTEDAKRILAVQGYDPAFGARPLKRVIQKMVGDPVAVAILSGTYPEGSTVTVDGAEDQLFIT